MFLTKIKMHESICYFQKICFMSLDCRPTDPCPAFEKMLAMHLVRVIVVHYVYSPMKKHMPKPNTGSELCFLLIIKYFKV